jgi:hypothetical protein
MTASSHTRYRDALHVLAGDAAVLPIVSEAGKRSGWWTSGRSWRRTYGRFTPHAPAIASIVFASEIPSQAICRVEMFERRSGDDDSNRDICHLDTEIGWARVTRFPYDPNLPGLPLVADGAAATVVRYHPGRRCTLRTTNRDRTVFAKVYASDTGARVFRDLVALRRAASHGELQMAIAKPLAWDASTRTLWQAALPGRSAMPGLCGPDGDDLARRMGRAAASLTRASVAPSAIVDGATVLARSRRHAADLVRRVPRLSAGVNTIVNRLSDIHARSLSRELRPIHGAPHPDQWLDAESEIGLIDFDRFGLGDPELDAGIVLADLHALDRPAMPVARLASSFLEGYHDAGVALREPLLQAYSAHQQLAKALRAAQAIRPDGDCRAEKHAARAARLLTEAVPT